MASLTVLVCPVCAAPLSPEASRCDYCGSVVVIQTDHPRIEPHRLNTARIDERIAGFRAALRQDPNDARAHYGLGVAYFNLGLLEAAVASLTRAVHLTPENPHIQAQLAVVHADMARNGVAGAERAAWERVSRALRLEPAHVDALLLKADLHARVNAWPMAVETWRRVAALDPDAARPPLARFLSAHQAIMLQTPRFAASDERVARRRRSHQQKLLYAIALLGYTAVALFIAFLLVGFLIIFLADAEWALSLIPLAGLVVLVILYRVIWLRYRRGVAGANALLSVSATEQTFLRGTVADAGQLVTAAAAVATALQQRRDVVVTRQDQWRAQVAVDQHRQAYQAGQRLTAATAYPSCLGGCGSRVLLVIVAVVVVVWGMGS